MLVEDLKEQLPSTDDIKELQQKSDTEIAKVSSKLAGTCKALELTQRNQIRLETKLTAQITKIQTGAVAESGLTATALRELRTQIKSMQKELEKQRLTSTLINVQLKEMRGKVSKEQRRRSSIGAESDTASAASAVLEQLGADNDEEAEEEREEEQEGGEEEDEEAGDGEEGEENGGGEGDREGDNEEEVEVYSPSPEERDAPGLAHWRKGKRVNVINDSDDDTPMEDVSAGSGRARKLKGPVAKATKKARVSWASVVDA